MVLVDTSVWIDHLRSANARLGQLLDAGEVTVHPYVIGELACGPVTNRNEILALISALPARTAVSHAEFLHFVESYRLAGQGIGFVDVHLLASALLNSDFLWTRDRKLDAAACRLKVAFR